MKVDLNIPIAENPNVIYVPTEMEAIEALKRDIVTAPGVLRKGNIYAVFLERADLCCDRNPTFDFLLNFGNVQLVGGHRCDCIEPDYTPDQFIYDKGFGGKRELIELFCRKIPFVQNRFVEPEMTLAEIIEAKVRREAEAKVKLECNMDNYGGIIQQTRNRILEDYVAERIREFHKRFE